MLHSLVRSAVFPAPSSSTAFEVRVGFLCLLAFASRTANIGPSLLRLSTAQDLALFAFSHSRLLNVFLLHETQIRKALSAYEAQLPRLARRGGDSAGEGAHANPGSEAAGDAASLREPRERERGQSLHGRCGEVDAELLALASGFPKTCVSFLQLLADEIPHKLPFFEVRQLACAASSFALVQRLLFSPAASGLPVILASDSRAASTIFSRRAASSALCGAGAGALKASLRILFRDLQRQASTLASEADARGVCALLHAFASAEATFRRASCIEDFWGGSATFDSTAKKLVRRLAALGEGGVSPQLRLLASHALSLVELEEPKALLAASAAGEGEATFSGEEEEAATTAEGGPRSRERFALRLALAASSRRRLCTQSERQWIEAQALEAFEESEESQHPLESGRLLLLTKSLQWMYTVEGVGGAFAGAALREMKRCLAALSKMDASEGSAFCSPRLLAVFSRASRFFVRRLQRQPGELGDEAGPTEEEATDVAEVLSLSTQLTQQSLAALDVDSLARLAEPLTLLQLQVARCLRRHRGGEGGDACSGSLFSLLLKRRFFLQRQRLLLHCVFARLEEEAARLSPEALPAAFKSLAATTRDRAAEEEEGREENSESEETNSAFRVELLRRLLRRLRKTVDLMQIGECKETRDALSVFQKAGVLDGRVLNGSAVGGGRRRANEENEDLRVFHTFTHLLNLRLKALNEATQKQLQQTSPSSTESNVGISPDELQDFAFSPAAAVQQLQVEEEEAESAQPTAADLFRDSLQEMTERTHAKLRLLEEEQTALAAAATAKAKHSERSASSPAAPSVASLLGVDVLGALEKERDAAPPSPEEKEVSLSPLLKQRSDCEASGVVSEGSGRRSSRKAKLRKRLEENEALERKASTGVSSAEGEVCPSEEAASSTAQQAPLPRHAALRAALNFSEKQEADVGWSGDSRLVVRSARLRRVSREAEGVTLDGLDFQDLDDASSSTSFSGRRRAPLLR